MKKFIGVLLLFFFSLFVTEAQQKVTYVDSIKQVTVNITSTDKKQMTSTDNIQLQLAKAVDNQAEVNTKLTDVMSSLSVGLEGYIKVVEARNKSDGNALDFKYKYSPEKVKHVIKVERWLTFSTLCLFIFYLFWVRLDRQWGSGIPASSFVIKLLYYGLLGIVGYYIVLKFLTLLFNGDYYVIKELTQFII